MFEKTVTLRSGIQVGQEQVGTYLADYCEGGRKLIVTFEPAGAEIDRSDSARNPWHLPLLSLFGYSVLGIKPAAVNWYRGHRLLEWFTSPRLREFLSQFQDVIFYGGSMGGFGALTFSRIVPGSLVVAYNPQSTLSPHLAPWDRRPESQVFDWSGAFSDAAEAAPLARRVYVFYDPFHVVDRKHVGRIDGPNVEHLKMPFLGHETPRWLMELGLLKDATEAAIAGSLSSATFARMIRKRRNTPRYYKVAAQRLRDAGRPHLSQLFSAAILQASPGTPSKVTQKALVA